MKKHTVIFSFAFILLACNEHKSTKMSPYNEFLQGDVLEVSNEIASFVKQTKAPIPIKIGRDTLMRTDSIAEDYIFIPLETTDESLLSTIDKICIDNDYIFINDAGSGKVFQFTCNGKFVRTIGKKGRGPNEYSKISDISINKKTKNLCLIDGGAAKLLYYDYEGTCVKEEPMYYMYSRMEYIDDSIRVLYTNNFHNEIAPSVDLFRLIIANNKQIPLYRDFPISEKRRNEYTYQLTNPLNSFFDGTYYCDLCSDTIWRITPKGCEATFILEFPQERLFFTSSELEDLSDEVFERKRAEVEAHCGSLLVTKDFVCFRIRRTDSSISYVIYNRKTRRVIRYGELLLPPIVHRLGDYFSANGYDFVFKDSLFVSILQPYEVKAVAQKIGKERYRQLQQKDKRLEEKIGQYDNPILMLVKLKK